MKRARPIWLKIPGNTNNGKNVDVSKRPYPCNALGQSLWLSQRCDKVSEDAANM